MDDGIRITTARRQVFTIEMIHLVGDNYGVWYVVWCMDADGEALRKRLRAPRVGPVSTSSALRTM